MSKSKKQKQRNKIKQSWQKKWSKHLTAFDTFFPPAEDFLRCVLIFVRRFRMSFIVNPATPRLTTRFSFPLLTRRRTLKLCPFLWSSLHAVVQARREAFFFWKYSDLALELISWTICTWVTNELFNMYIFHLWNPFYPISIEFYDWIFFTM